MHIDPVIVLRAVAVFLIISAVVRGILTRRKAKTKTGGNAHFPVAGAVRTAGGLCAAAALWIGAPMLLSREVAVATRWLAGAAMISSLMDFAAGYLWLRQAP